MFLYETRQREREIYRKLAQKVSLCCWHKMYNNSDDDNFFYYHNTSLRGGIERRRLRYKINKMRMEIIGVNRMSCEAK